MAEYIKVYPTAGLTERTMETYWNAFRDYLLADEDVSAQFDISECYQVGNNHFGFKIIPKNIGNDTGLSFGGRSDGEYCNIRAYFNGTSDDLQNYKSTRTYTTDEPLILIKDEGLILFAFGSIYSAVMFADLTNTYSGQTINYIFSVSGSTSYAINYARTGSSYSRLSPIFHTVNEYEQYILYPLIINNGFTHKSLYVYDGGESELVPAVWLIDNHKFAALGRYTDSSNPRGGRILIRLD